jgi:hypothetical protein
MRNPVDIGAKQVYHLPEPLRQTEVKIEKDAEDEQAGHDVPSATPSTTGGLESPPPTKPRALKRKRKSDSPHPDPLPAIITQKIPGLASFETVVFLSDRLRLLSDSPSDHGQSLIDDHQSRHKASTQSLPRRQRLEMLWSRIGDNTENQRWATALRRIYQAEFFGQYPNGTPSYPYIVSTDSGLRSILYN